MTKKFVITAESDLCEAEFRTNDIDEAIEVYEQFCDVTKVPFTSVNLCDGETGELLASQRIQSDAYGTQITRWVAA